VDYAKVKLNELLGNQAIKNNATLGSYIDNIVKELNNPSCV